MNDHTAAVGPYRAIFFDLDGTLLPLDVDEFMRDYFAALGAYVARFGVSPFCSSLCILLEIRSTW